MFYSGKLNDQIASGAEETKMRLSARTTDGLLALCLTVAIPLTAARAEPAVPYDLGQKFVTEHKVKSLIGPSVQVDEQGYVAMAWMEEEKDVRSVLFARSIAPGGPMGTPVLINRPEEAPYWRQESPALVVQGEEVFVAWGLTHPKSTPQQPLATELRLSRSIDGGRTPVVAVNDQGLFALAWMEHGMPGHKIVTQTLRVPSVKVAESAR